MQKRTGGIPMYGILIAGAIFVLVGAIALLLYVTMQRPSVEQKTMQMTTTMIVLITGGHLMEITSNYFHVSIIGLFIILAILMYVRLQHRFYLTS